MSEHVNDCDCCQRKLAALRIAGTIDGIHLRQRDAYRDALTDLIEDLRGLIARTEAEGWPDDEIIYVAAPFITTRIDRAEARLLAVTDE